MKILQLGKFYPIRGGVEKVMWSITLGLAERGIPCDMLCAKLPNDGPDPDHRLMAEETPEGLVISFSPENRVICVPAITKKAATMISPAMIRWMRRHAAEYDIIHIHHPDPMAALALRLSDFKGRIVLHWHSDIVAQKFLLKFYKPLQDWLIQRAKWIVGTTPVYLQNSPYLAQVQDKTVCVPIGIEPIIYDEYQVQEFRNLYPGKKIVFALGRLVPYKGFDSLIDAAAILPDNYVVLIGGVGPLHNTLQEQIRKQKLEKKVRLLGYIRNEDIAEMFGACSVFVMSSKMKSEAFGIVQIEAMSCARPVVATTIPGSDVSWVNENGFSGLNVPPMNAHALAMAIQKICSNPDTYQRFSDGALERFATCFTSAIMIDRTIQLYAEEDYY